MAVLTSSWRKRPSCAKRTIPWKASMTPNRLVLASAEIMLL